ncbi:MAG TPA: DUF1207 domain-containing protein [Gemmatimonadales bacterium]|jgi:hypothetical protein|nr:DUF1207 domain-containing protein [Gemmatimonadales bacterium]
MSSRLSGPWLALAFLVGLPSAGAAQARIFPNVPSFERPEASPRVHGLAGRVISVQRGESRFGEEAEAEVALGENFPVLALRRGERPITLGLGSQVYARFSLGDGKDALISNDWVVGLNSTALLGAWALTVEFYHESSHLGDEYEDRFNAKRIDWTREVLAAWASYTAGAWRLTGSASYALRDELQLERPGGSIGVDFRPPRRNSGGMIRPVGGIYLDASAATRWRVSGSLKAGVALQANPNGREIGLAVIAHDGLSTQRQFFRQESRYLGLEVRFDL